MSFRDLWSGIFWLAISTCVCLISIPISIGTLHSPGPGFLPFWSGVALGIFSIALIITSILKEKVEEKISNLWKGMDWHKVIWVLAALFIYAILLPSLGYLIATSGLLAFLLSLLSRQRLWIPVVSAIITAVVSYLLFYVWLDVQLPKGILGF